MKNLKTYDQFINEGKSMSIKDLKVGMVVKTTAKKLPSSGASGSISLWIRDGKVQTYSSVYDGAAKLKTSAGFPELIVIDAKKSFVTFRIYDRNNHYLKYANSSMLVFNVIIARSFNTEWELIKTDSKESNRNYINMDPYQKPDEVSTKIGTIIGNSKDIQKFFELNLMPNTLQSWEKDFRITNNNEDIWKLFMWIKPKHYVSIKIVVSDDTTFIFTDSPKFSDAIFKSLTDSYKMPFKIKEN